MAAVPVEVAGRDGASRHTAVPVATPLQGKHACRRLRRRHGSNPAHARITRISDEQLPVRRHRQADSLLQQSLNRGATIAAIADLRVGKAVAPVLPAGDEMNRTVWRDHLHDRVLAHVNVAPCVGRDILHAVQHNIGRHRIGAEKATSRHCPQATLPVQAIHAQIGSAHHQQFAVSANPQALRLKTDVQRARAIGDVAVEAAVADHRADHPLRSDLADAPVSPVDEVEVALRIHFRIHR